MPKVITQKAWCVYHRVEKLLFWWDGLFRTRKEARANLMDSDEIVYRVKVRYTPSLPKKQKGAK